MPTVKFLTLGCKVNQYDTQEIRERFHRCGFMHARARAPADIYVINTCTVTHKTDASSLAFIRRARAENPGAYIIVTGCLAERDTDTIHKGGTADLILGNKDKARIMDILAGRKFFPSFMPGDGITGISDFEGHTRAFLKVQDGCDNRCSYCKVWLARGPSRSKPLAQVRTEAARLCANGFKEIVLCGICLGSYGKEFEPRLSLNILIKEISRIRALRRIRLSSIEAADLGRALIREVAGCSKVCRHFHIPMQSGDNRILKAMNRRYRRKDYLNLVHTIRTYMPECAISTDILVGFPGETEAQFNNTLDLIKRSRPMRVHAFPYSPRPGTAAFRKKPTDACLVKERMKRLKAVSDECARAYMHSFIGKRASVLFEEKIRLRGTWYWQGYTDTYVRVRVQSKHNLKNKILSVKIGKRQVCEAAHFA